MALSITVDDWLGRDLDEAVAGGNRSAVVAQAVREDLDRRRITAAVVWHASCLVGQAGILSTDLSDIPAYKIPVHPTRLI
jgi:hypothetical protein